MTPSELQQNIYNLLRRWRGDDSLKELFWAQLNYDRVALPISMAGWPQAAADPLAEPPLILAEAGDFKILYARLKGNLRLTDERAIVNRLQRDYPYALYCFAADERAQRLHLVNVRDAHRLAGADGRAARAQRLVLRRIAIGPEERPRTAAERLAMLDAAAIGGDLFGRSPLAVQQAHDKAFDVEAVTQDFYKGYKRVFAELQDYLRRDRAGMHNTGAATNEEAHDHALQTLNRVMFLYFIQRKRWLGDDPDFIRNYWDAYRTNARPADTFYRDWLSVLFFEAFNDRYQAGRADRRYLPERFRNALALAPYLNGGLFIRNALDEAFSTNIPDAFFATLFDAYDGQTPGFFERYNFTITEDTPFDQEVAVDPEMIGKVYENLVNVTAEGVSDQDQRGDRGMFYTPRVEIDLMCRLALLDYLTNHLGACYRDILRDAVWAYDPDEARLADQALARADLWPRLDALLRELTFLDPACGSGSFLVGMLAVLDDLQARANAQLGRDETPYERRKRIIGASLYGVEVMPWAARVAELRLWLQLVVETELHPAERRFKPLLPNLSFKVRLGDSLVQEVGGVNFALRAHQAAIPAPLKGRLTRLKGEKVKFYNNANDRAFRTQADLEREELDIFRAILDARADALQARTRELTHALDRLMQQGNLPGLIPSRPTQPSLLEKQQRAELEAARAELDQVEKARAALHSARDVPFVWDIAFVEIFEGDRAGFDIVAGNPPYVRQERIAPPTLRESDFAPERWKELKKAYKERLQISIAAAWPKWFGYKPATGEQTHKLDGKSDLYLYFFLHGLSLLHPQGAFAFITSNSWLDVGYGADLQAFLLRCGHVRLILDNQVARSFAQADVNTCITLLGAADDARREAALDEADPRAQRTARFVMFRVPFEAALSSVTWAEVDGLEAATGGGRLQRPEFRAIARAQAHLWAEGLAAPDDDDAPPAPNRPRAPRYTGNKWGGKYLRAPEIYWTILEKGRDKLVPLGQLADVRRGFTTGANEFFYLDEAAIARWGIEERFLRPVIKSPKECKRIVVNPADLKFKLFMCHEERAALRGTAAAEYIAWGESQGFHRRPSCQGRPRWWDVGERPGATMNCNYLINEVMRFYIHPFPFYVSDNFQEIHSTIDSYQLAVSCNCTISQLLINMMGRANFGGGLLKIQTYEVTRLIVPDPDILPAFVAKRLVSDAAGLGLQGPDRRALDDIVFDALGLTRGERDAVYEAVIELVGQRLRKAASV